MILCVNFTVNVKCVGMINVNVFVWVMVHHFVICLNVLFLIVRIKIVIESVFHMMS